MAKVLLIEDDNSWLRKMRGWLEGFGHDVTYANTEGKARAILESTKAENRGFAVIVLDLRLRAWESGFEGMNLLDLTDKRADEEHTEVIIVTAFGKLIHAREAYSEHKISDFLPKADESLDFKTSFRDSIHEAIRKYEEAHNKA